METRNWNNEDFLEGEKERLLEAIMVQIIVRKIRANEYLEKNEWLLSRKGQHNVNPL